MQSWAGRAVQPEEGDSDWQRGRQLKDIKQRMSSSLEKDSKPVCPYLHVSPPTNPLSIKEEYWEEDDNSTMKDKQSMSSSREKDSKPVCSLSSLSLTDSLKSLLDNAGLRFRLTSDGKIVLFCLKAKLKLK